MGFDRETPEHIGKYEILSILGEGGMGVVYRARHRESGQITALKTVKMANVSLLQNIRREIQALAAIRHPGIVRIYDEGVHEGLPWYAMELLDGVPLKDWFGTSLARTTSSLNRPDSGAIADAEDRTGVISDMLTDSHQMAIRSERQASESRSGQRQGDDRAMAVGSFTDSPAIRADKTMAIGAGTGIDGNSARSDDSRYREQSRCPFTNRFDDNLAMVLKVFHGMCLPLAFLHGEGFVHRDLKPDNIIIKPDGTPVLVDFGIMTQFGATIGRESLAVDQNLLGTVSYMAPEQIRGEFVDARTDIYALGCIFYEIIVGHPPFIGVSANQILLAHLNSQPVSPAAFCRQLPKKLENVILGMLAKSPRERIGYADTIAANLVEIGALDISESEHVHPRRYLYRPMLHDRDDLTKGLGTRVKRLKEGYGGLILLHGATGSGKTRFLMEAGRLAAREAATIMTGTLGGPGTGPLEVMRKPLQIIADFCREHGPEETTALLEDRAPLLALYEPSLAEVPGFDESLSPEELPLDAAKLRSVRAVLDTLLAYAERQSTILILDDLQWADELTRMFLTLCSRSEFLIKASLLIIGCYRRDDAMPMLDTITEEQLVESISLPPLSGEAVTAMTADMLAMAVPPRLLTRFLIRTSEGIPFMVAEYLHTAVGTGLLNRDERGNWQVIGENGQILTGDDIESLPLPTRLEDLLQQRLSDLPEWVRSVSEAAAVIGRDIPYDALIRTAVQDETVIATAVNQLVLRRLLEMTKNGDLRFTHDRIWDYVLNHIESSDVKVLHGKAALAIESLFPDHLDQWAASLGKHWEMTGEHGKAIACYRTAIEKATTNFGFEEAERVYIALIPLVKVKREQIVLRNKFGNDILQMTGRMAEAEHEHQLAVDEAMAEGHLDLAWTGLAMLARVHHNRGNLEQSRLLYEQALKGFENEGNHYDQAAVIGNLALLASQQGYLENAEKLFTEALDLQQKTGNRREELRTRSNLAIFFHSKGRLQEARQQYEDNLTRFRSMANRLEEGKTLGNLALLLRGTGQVNDAKKLFHDALAIHRQLGNRKDEASITGNLAGISLVEGDLDAADELYHQAVAIHREVGNRRDEANCLSNLALLKSMKNLLDDAVAISLQARPIYQAMGDKRSEGNVLANLALFEGLRGHIQQAWTIFDQALPLLRETGDIVAEGIVLGWMATLKRRTTEDFPAAESLIDAAIDILEEAGAKRNLAECWCEKGHIALAKGMDVHHWLQKAREIAVHSNAAPESDLGKAVTRLEHAILDTEENRDSLTLHHGERISDIPLPLRPAKAS